MKLAVYTVSLPEYNLEESVSILKEMGYEGVEWRVDKTEGESPPEGYVRQPTRGTEVCLPLLDR